MKRMDTMYEVDRQDREEEVATRIGYRIYANHNIYACLANYIIIIIITQ